MHAGIALIIFFVVYQQFENHVFQPLVYGRTVQLSPLIVLISVLMGAKVAGVIGALGAIPVAGSIQVFVVDWLSHRRQRLIEPSAVRNGRPAPVGTGLFRAVYRGRGLSRPRTHVLRRINRRRRDRAGRDRQARAARQQFLRQLPLQPHVE